MKTYTYSEARQRLATLLDQARRDGQVMIRRQDGTAFVVQPVVPASSPLDVPGVRSRLRRGELIEILRTERERAGNRFLSTEARPGSRLVKERRRGSGLPARKKKK